MLSSSENGVDRRDSGGCRRTSGMDDERMGQVCLVDREENGRGGLSKKKGDGQTVNGHTRCNGNGKE